MRSYGWRSMIYRYLSLVLVCAMFLAGCSQANSTPMPTVVLNTPAVVGTPAQVVSGSVSASAEIVPAQKTDLGFAMMGIVQTINISEGDVVKAGQVLASLDTLPQLQSALDASQKNLTSAQRGYDDLINNAPLERANAELNLVKAQKTVVDAQKAVQSKQFQRASQQTIDIAKANLIVAQNSLTDAESIYNRNKFRSQTDVNYAAALAQLASAQQLVQQAQYNYNYVSSLPDPLDIQAAQANLDVANANLLAVKSAWEQVKDTPENQEVLAAQAQIATAQASLAASQAAVEHAMVKAPFDGTVVNLPITPGEAVSPGQTALTIANLQTMQVQTTDLSERDINRVTIGQTARVTVPGLGQDLDGKVTAIAQQANKVGGDVVYQVIIQFVSQPVGLRWGMSATVQIGQ
jgi:HlyD family secretion protein